jgi:hypothetical protein
LTSSENSHFVEYELSAENSTPCESICPFLSDPD